MERANFVPGVDYRYSVVVEWVTDSPREYEADSVGVRDNCLVLNCMSRDVDNKKYTRIESTVTVPLRDVMEFHVTDHDPDCGMHHPDEENKPGVMCQLRTSHIGMGNAHAAVWVDQNARYADPEAIEWPLTDDEMDNIRYVPPPTVIPNPESYETDDGLQMTGRPLVVPFDGGYSTPFPPGQYNVTQGEDISKARPVRDNPQA